MFSYDPVTNKPVGFKFLDFQLARTASRATDLNYFLHTSLSFDIMVTKQEKILEMYHSYFIPSVIKLGIDPEEHQLTLENLKTEFEERRIYGFSMGMMLAPLVAANPADIPDMESLTAEDMGEEASQEFFSSFMKKEVTAKLKTLAAFAIPKVPEYANVE